MTRRLLLLAAACLALGSSAAAQTVDSSATSIVPPTQAFVVVDAADGVVRLRVDGEATDRPARPGAATAVAPGVAVDVTLVDDPGAWNPLRATARVGPLAAGDTARVALALPVRYRVETMPQGATVVLDGPDGTRTLGLAPLTVDLPRNTQASVVARLDGYADARARLDGAGGRVTLALDGVGGAAPPVVLLPTERSYLSRTLTDLGIGALTLAAGAVAVYYKFEADARDDRYRDPNSAERGLEPLRTEAESFDRRSAIALGAMQVGVGVLALRFVLR
jgi:hypothetical protein